MGMFAKIRRMFGGDESTEGASIELRQGTAEFHFFLARGELERCENLGHGFSHLIELLAFDPDRDEWNALVERYRQAAAPRTLLDVLGERGEHAYYATEAFRARLFAEQGDIESAVDLFAQVAQAKPDVPYIETWLLPFLEPPGVYESLSRPVALQFASTVLNTVPEPPVARRRARLQRLARVIARLDRAGLGDLAAMVDMVIIGIHRKAGLWDEALALAKHAAASRPSWHAFVALGLVHRARDECAEAEAAFDRSREHDPQDVTSLLETGDMFFNRRQWQRARDAYQQVLARQPDHPWAVPSIAFCRWQETSSEDLPEPLIELARAGNGRANGILDRFRPYHGFLPTSSEALANAIRQMIAQDVRKATIALSDVESPSNQLVCAALRARDGFGELTLQYSHIAEPDPRLPIEELPFSLWKLVNDELVPAVSPPPAEIAQRIAQLARMPFDPEKNWAAASDVGWGPSQIPALLACAVHPPVLTHDEADPFEWIARVQLVAAQVIAHTEPHWEGSTRRDALMSMLLGPRDWLTSAAIIVLAALAREEPATFVDIHDAFGRLDAARPNRGAVHYEDALFHHWASLPQLFDNEREALLERLGHLHED